MTPTDDDPRDDLCDLPLEIAVAGRAVVLLGPGRVFLEMTADAADKSAKLLQAAADRAREG